MSPQQPGFTPRHQGPRVGPLHCYRLSKIKQTLVRAEELLLRCCNVEGGGLPCFHLQRVHSFMSLPPGVRTPSAANPFWSQVGPEFRNSASACSHTASLLPRANYWYQFAVYPSGLFSVYLHIQMCICRKYVSLLYLYIYMFYSFTIHIIL